MLATALAACVLAYGGSLAPALGTARLLQAVDELGLDAYVTGSPACPKKARHCVGIAVHVVEEDGEPVQTPVWFYEQVRTANELFAPINVGFRVVSVDGLPAEQAFIDTREERDVLGRPHHGLGVAHVFVVRRLADVDIEGEEIRGVHWRDRANRTRRWIILSSIASRMVLAHELGHFFGLPHSKHDISIMNKRPRALPLWSDRVFHAAEQTTMATRRTTMLEDGTLTDAR